MIHFAPLMVLAVTACYARTITPSEMTYTAIGETIYRIHLYAKANVTFPKLFAELPTRENYANRTIDGWGMPLVYKLTQTEVLSLTSLGSDGLLVGKYSK